MGSEHQGESRWSANRLVAVGQVESQASSGELIEMGGLGVGIAVAAQGRLQVINEKKEDIGTTSGGVVRPGICRIQHQQCKSESN